jgi:tetratricopeptide (TPR) repeat protein
MNGGDAIRSGEALETAGDFLDAAAAYQSAAASSDPLIVADAKFHLGRIAWRQGRFDEAVGAYEEARAITLAHDANELRARIENGLGAIHYARGEFAQARACYAVALELATDETQRGRVLLNLGAIANIEGDYEEARKAYQRSRLISQRAGYRRGEAMALHNLGMLAADEERWDDADEAYRRCLELLEVENDRSMIAKVLNNRVDVSTARGRYDEAVALADRALAMYVEIGEEIGRGETLRSKGNALFAANRAAEAERALHDAVRIGHRTQVKLLEAEASRDLAHIFVARGDTAGARKSLERALVLFEELGAQRELLDVRAELDQLAPTKPIIP